ncbi:MAG: hypothetical protein ABI564_00765 [Ideonella sp.]
MNAPEKQIAPRLSSLSHGGGCGCKIAPGAVLGCFADLGFASAAVIGSIQAGEPRLKIR